MATEECARCKMWLAGGRMGSTNSLCQFRGVVRANPSITLTPVMGVCADKQTSVQNWPNTSTKLEFVLARCKQCSEWTCKHAGMEDWNQRRLDNTLNNVTNLFFPGTSYMNGIFLINLLTILMYFIYFWLIGHIDKYLMAQCMINTLIIRACLLPHGSCSSSVEGD